MGWRWMYQERISVKLGNLVHDYAIETLGKTEVYMVDEYGDLLTEIDVQPSVPHLPTLLETGHVGFTDFFQVEGLAKLG